jgi:hypothetical protein
MKTSTNNLIKNILGVLILCVIIISPFVYLIFIRENKIEGCKCGTSAYKLAMFNKSFSEWHNLHRLNSMSETLSYIKGGGSFLGWSVEGDSKLETFITFAFSFKDYYLIKQLNVNKIRVKINNNIKIPRIKFYWHEHVWYDEIGFCREEQLNIHDFNDSIIYAEIECGQEDWERKDIKLPLGG